jgi:hypothetical protein
MSLTLNFTTLPEHRMNITPEVYDIARQEYYIDVDETLPVTIGYCDPEKPDVPCISFEPAYHYVERNDTGKMHTLSFEIVTRGMLGDFKIRYRCDDYDQGGDVCDQYVNIDDVKKDKNGKPYTVFYNEGDHPDPKAPPTYSVTESAVMGGVGLGKQANDEDDLIKWFSHDEIPVLTVGASYQVTSDWDTPSNLSPVLTAGVSCISKKVSARWLADYLVAAWLTY